MEMYFKKYNKYSLLFSVLLFVLALFLIFMPLKSVNTIVMIFGSIILISGIIHIFSYMKNLKKESAYSFELTFGLVLLVIGLVLMVKPLIIVNIFVYIIAIWMLIEGIVKTQTAISIKKVSSKWFLVLIFSIISMVAGFIILFNPFATSMALITLTGIFLAITQVLSFCENLFILSKIK